MQTVARTRVLSASKVGHPCDRNLWYAAQGVKEEVDPKARRIFAVGHALEALVVQFMREDGFLVFHNDKTHADPTDFRLHLEGGVLTGRYDILFQRPGEPGLVLGDVKTMNRQAYAFWRRKGTLEKYPQYAKQLTVYFKGLQTRKEVAPQLNGTLAVVGFCKDDSRYAIDYFDYSEALWEEIRERCERIFTSEKPVDPGKIPSWACSYCGYRHICDAKPEKEPGDDGCAVVDDQELELAAYMWEEATNLEAEARQLKKEARAILEKVRDKERFRVGSYLVSITPVRSQRLDTRALREKAPEVYHAFLKESVSYRINVKSV